MRKLKLQMHITTDGFVAGPNGEIDWMTASMDEMQFKMLTDLTESMDTIIMGRGMVNEFTTYWENVVNNQPDSPEYPYAKIFVETPKIVFSRTLTTLKAENVHIENGGLGEAVNTLKNQPGKDIIVYGGANFVSSLLKYKLIDELYLFVNPVAIGEGLRIFKERINLQVIQSTAVSNGVILNCYHQLS